MRKVKAKKEQNGNDRYVIFTFISNTLFFVLDSRSLIAGSIGPTNCHRL